MNELSDAQYNHLRTNINKLPWVTISKFLSWGYNGRRLTIEDFPLAEGDRRDQIVDFFNNQPDLQEQNDWRNLQPYMNADTINELQILISHLNAYIARWSPTSPNGNSLDVARKKKEEAEERVKNMTLVIENEEWLRLDQFSVNALLQYYTKFPYTSHKDEIDSSVYALACNVQNNQVEAMQKYLKAFPQGMHVAEAQKKISDHIDWADIKSTGDIYRVYQYTVEHPDSTLLGEARTLLLRLKENELNRMKIEFNEYSRERLLGFIHQGIFTEQELIYAEVATENSLRILRDYSNIRQSLPILDDVAPMCTAETFPNHVDIFMFGVPATGKSCVLAGLLSSNMMNYDSVLSGGRYADAMRKFVDNNCPPDPTRVNYLTTIKASVSENNKVHYFDLVEMAGEEFASKIADNAEGSFCFEDMGTGATDLLGSNNKKVFFLIVDPTKSRIRFTKQEEYTDVNNQTAYRSRVIVFNQKDSLKRIVDMFNQPENRKVMANVDAIHFIVTKADTLGNTKEDRLNRAVNIMNTEYSLAIETLKRVCKEYGINRSTKGVPYVFPFSLGEFYVGNVFEYDSEDSNTIIDVMKGNTMAISEETFWDKFKALMNKGF